jgi:hypothetical protein
MVSQLSSSTIDRGFEPWSGQIKDYNIGIWCFFFTKYTALRSKSKYWLSQNQNKMSKWSDMSQGSPNQAKWATSSPWFQWSRPISVKKRSFSRPVSLFKSVFFSPIIILFLQYSHKRSSHVPEMWPIQGLMFNILFQTR